MRATRDLVACLMATSLVVGVSWYATHHPWFASNVLLPILGLAFVVCLWGFFYCMAKAR
jgi:hypothetical protein